MKQRAFIACHRPVRPPVFLMLCAVATLLCTLSPSLAQDSDRLDPIVVVPETPVIELTHQTMLGEGYPPLRGFRAPVLNPGPEVWLFGLPSDAPDTLSKPADVANANLSRRGLLGTIGSVIQEIGAATFAQLSPAEQLARLRLAGLPVDLLAHFKPPHGDAAGRIERLLANITADQNPMAATSDAVTPMPPPQFDFAPTHPRFRVATESGEHDLGLLRLQLTRGDDWLGDGDGGAVDIARQLVALLPESEFIVSIRAEHLTTLLATTRDWPSPLRDFTIVSESFPLTQWAQDNGKPGLLLGEDGRPATLATIAPRYASRRDEASLFVPGESFAMDGLAAAGHTVIHSPLLFQGGNLMAVRDPKDGRRILLIGEAEIHRNIALGLSREQTLEAFRIEFGVDECRVLPSVSFHIDFDLTVRAVGDRLVAFVQDTSAGAKIILSAGIGVLVRAGHMSAQTADAARAALETDDPQSFLPIIAPVMAKQVDAAGHFSESFAKAFSTSPVDSHVGNLRLFLVAMDTFVHRVAKSSAGETQAYLRSFERLETDRRALHAFVESWGWKVVPVPCLGEGDRVINPLNGIHDRARYFMPSVGGLYAEMDAAAMAHFRSGMGDGVTIIPIRCAETQRRAGSLHCAAAAYPRISSEGSPAKSNQDQ